MDAILSCLADPNKKLRPLGVEKCAAALATWKTSDGALALDGWSALVAPLVACLRDSNSKVCAGALGCLQALVSLVGGAARPYLSRAVPEVAEYCLGSTKPPVREAGVAFLVAASEDGGFGAGALLEVLKPAFAHKTQQARTSLHNLLARIAVAPELAERRALLAPLVVAGVSDSSEEVRAAAIASTAALLAALGPSIHETLEQAGMRPAALAAAARGAVVADGSEASASGSDVAAAARTSRIGRAPLPSRQQQRLATATAATAAAAAAATGAASSGSAAGASGFDALVPIQPASLYVERDVHAEVEAVRLLLSHTSDWKGWVTGLQRLAGAAAGGAGRFDAVLVAAVRGTLQELVAKKITDLRSAVAREACRCVAVVAGHTGDAFAPLAALWLPPLLRNASVAKEVFFTSADAAVRAVIAATRTGFRGMLPPLLEGAKAKIPTVRRASVLYLQLSLSTWTDSDAAFGGDGAAVADAVTKAVADSDEAVRAAARRLFWVLERRFPAAADRVRKGLDVARQRQLLEEHGKFNVDAEFRAAAAVAANVAAAGGRWAAAPPPVVSPAAVKTVATAAAAAAATAAATTAAFMASPTDAVQLPVAVAGAAPLQTSKPLLPPSPPVISAGAAAAAAATAAAAPRARPDPKARAARRMTMGAPMRVAPAAFASSEGGGGIFAAEVPAPGIGGAIGDTGFGGFRPGAQRVARLPVRHPLQQQRDIGGGDSGGSIGSAAAAAAAAASLAGPMRVPRAARRESLMPPPFAAPDASAATAATAEVPLAAMAEVGSVGATSTAAAAAAAVGGTSTAGPQRISRQGSVVDGEQRPLGEAELLKRRHHALQGLEELVRQASDDYWETRLKAMAGMLRLFDADNGGSSSRYGAVTAANAATDIAAAASAGGGQAKALLQRWEASIAERVCDRTYKVAEAALKVLLAMLRQNQSHATAAGQNQVQAAAAGPAAPFLPLPRLQALLLPVFSRLRDAKEAIHTAAVAVLDASREAYPAQQLCAVLLPKLSELPTDRAKAGLLDFALALAPHSAGYLTNSAQQRSLVLRLGSMLLPRGGGGGGHGDDSTAAAAAARLLAALYRLDGKVFVAAVATLPHDAGAAVRGALAIVAPDLDRRVAAHLRVAPQQDHRDGAAAAATRASTLAAAAAAVAAGVRSSNGAAAAAPPEEEKAVAAVPQAEEHAAIELRQGDCGSFKPSDAYTGTPGAPKAAATAAAGTSRTPARRPLQTVTNTALGATTPAASGSAGGKQPGGGKQRASPPFAHSPAPQATGECAYAPSPQGQQQQQQQHQLALAGGPAAAAAAAAATAAEILAGLARNAPRQRKAAALKALRGLVDGSGSSGKILESAGTGTVFSQTFWDRYFGQFLTALLDGAAPQPAGESTGDAAAWARQELLSAKYLQALRCLVARRPALFHPLAEVAVCRLLECAGRGRYGGGIAARSGDADGARAAAGAAGVARLEVSAALADLVGVLDPSRSLSSLQLYMGPAAAAATAAAGTNPAFGSAAASAAASASAAAAAAAADVRCEALRALSVLTPRLPSPQLLAALRGPSLLPALDAALLDPGDLLARQLAVAAVVEMYQVLGEALLPFLARLPKVRLKLITLYISRREEKTRAAAAGAGMATAAPYVA